MEKENANLLITALGVLTGASALKAYSEAKKFNRSKNVETIEAFGKVESLPETERKELLNILKEYSNYTNLEIARIKKTGLIPEEVKTNKDLKKYLRSQK